MDLTNRLRIDARGRIPLVTQVSRQIAWLISAGQLQAGDRLPSLRGMAADLGINLHTVRAAYGRLEQDGLVVTRQGSRTVVLPRDPGRRTARGSDVPGSTFGVIIPENSEFYRPLLDGIDEAAYAVPALVVVGNARESQETGLRHLDRMIARGVDGVVIAGPMVPTQEARARAVTFPAMVFADWPGGPEPLVLFDLEEAAATATRHLIDHGHKRLGLVAPPVHWENVEPLHRGFRRALRRSRHPAGTAATVHDFTAAAGERATRALFEQEHPPTAILAASDSLAVGVLRALAVMGRRVPDDVALIGIGDTAIATLVDPALTAVRLPAHRMGLEAMRLLLRISAGEPTDARRIVLYAPLIVRRSCGCETGPQIQEGCT